VIKLVAEYTIFNIVLASSLGILAQIIGYLLIEFLTNTPDEKNVSFLVDLKDKSEKRLDKC
jgi:hypothetical protein